MGHMAQLRQLMGVSDDLHKVRASSSTAAGAAAVQPLSKLITQKRAWIGAVDGIAVQE
jgi:hypothetical protein